MGKKMICVQNLRRSTVYLNISSNMTIAICIDHNLDHSEC